MGALQLAHHGAHGSSPPTIPSRGMRLSPESTSLPLHIYTRRSLIKALFRKQRFLGSKTGCPVALTVKGSADALPAAFCGKHPQLFGSDAEPQPPEGSLAASAVHPGSVSSTLKGGSPTFAPANTVRKSKLAATPLKTSVGAGRFELSLRHDQPTSACRPE